MQDMLKTKEAADYMRLTKSTLQSWRSSGIGPKFLRIGRTIRYRKADIDRFIMADGEKDEKNMED